MTITTPSTNPRSTSSADGDRLRLASPVDTDVHGEYRIIRDPADARPLYRFTGRLESPATLPADTPAQGDEPARFVAAPGRFHLYSGWFCPWAHRSTLVVALAGLSEAVSVSYVDGARDARGWAFRESNGPDPVNGFTLLRDAYDATEPGFDGHVSVPTLWDRRTGRVASNAYATLDSDLASEFRLWSSTGVDLYPHDRRDEIDRLDRWLGPIVNHGVQQAARPGAEGQAARADLLKAFRVLDESLSLTRYLLGNRLTLADVRLFVTLVRYDVGANAEGRVGPRLDQFPSLWAYARDVFQLPAFRATTDLGTFTRPGATVPDWEAPADRADPEHWAAA